MALALTVGRVRPAAGQVFLGNDAALTGGAVGAQTRDSDAVWYNPAGLAGVVRTKVELSASLFSYRLREVKDISLHVGSSLQF